jgi:cobalt-zinc-cadmium efflux system outer membrane protein
MTLTLAAAVAAAFTVATPLTEQDAVSAALAKSRDLIAARLSVDAAEVDKVAALVWPNPVAAYSLGNLVLKPGNPQGMGLDPGFFDQPIQSVSLSQVIDVWFKHAKRWDVAARGVEVARLQVEQATREVVHAVRAAFAEVLHAQEELTLEREIRERYDETRSRMQSQLKAEAISPTDYKKIELEQLRAQQAELEAKLQLELSRERLAELLVLLPGQLPEQLAPYTPEPSDTELGALTERALSARPDLNASKKAIERAQAALASQRREAFPDLALGLSYTHDNFTVSGDNANTVGANLAIALPVFDRNQGPIGHARVDLLAAQNDHDRLELAVRHDVADAARRLERARVQHDLLEHEVGPRAEATVSAAERLFRAGSTSMLEFLEAQRTWAEVRRDGAQALLSYRQAAIDVAYAVGVNR